MKKMIIIFTFAFAAAVCAFGWLLSVKPKTVGKAIKESDFMEFYYTYSSTVNPPEFQRYRIYTENGKIIFYHEKREGDKVFLTEEDITVSGELELTTEEWETIWNCLIGGTVKNRTESTAAGGSGPWFYLYWNGDKNQCQKFNFADLQKETVFEEFCADLISR